MNRIVWACLALLFLLYLPMSAWAGERKVQYYPGGRDVYHYQLFYPPSCTIWVSREAVLSDGASLPVPWQQPGAAPIMRWPDPAGWPRAWGPNMDYIPPVGEPANSPYGGYDFRNSPHHGGRVPKSVRVLGDD